MHRKLPDGSEEQPMTNLSLARIMYGTSEEYHASASTTAAALSAPSLTHSADKSDVEQETLGELLHRAWTILSSKH
jgi:hypothetical protein